MTFNDIFQSSFTEQIDRIGFFGLAYRRFLSRKRFFVREGDRLNMRPARYPECALFAFG